MQHLIDVGKFLVLTSGGTWSVDGGADGILTPLDINLRQQERHGAGGVAPITVGTSALFIQSRGAIVRDLKYDINVDGYTGRDLTVFSSHLFDGFAIIDWEWQETPHSIVWSVRSDGALLGLTYLPEHEVWGWHRHDTGQDNFDPLGNASPDKFESVTCVPEGDEDAVYVVTRRWTGYTQKRYIERFATRSVTDVTTDAVFVDCATTYDGRGPGDISINSSSLPNSLFSPDGAFVVGDVGKYIRVYGNGTHVDALVTSFTSANSVNVTFQGSVPADLVDATVSTWARVTDTVTGLVQLDSRDVSVLADGNAYTDDLFVSGGALTIPERAAVIHVGLPIVAEVETLDLETVQAETLSDKTKRVNRVTIQVEDTRGLAVGDREDAQLTICKQTTTNLDRGDLYSGPVEFMPRASWNQHGRTFIRQSEPLPATILAITPSLQVGG